MKKSKIYSRAFCSLFVLAILFAGCTKYQSGFISNTMQYSVSTFTVIKGHLTTSNSLVSDGSDIPLKIEWTHIYDSSGNVVDSIFHKKYTVGVWTAAYDPNVDTNYALIMAKRSTQQLEPIVLNATSGVLEANSGTYYVPSGTYTMDLQVTNDVGVKQLKDAMTIIIQDGDPVEITPQTGNFSVSRIYAGTASGVGFYNGTNNPFVAYNLTRIADTPNVFVLKFMDRNGVAYDPKLGEVEKRPNSGINPNPPFLQNLQDYAPDTYIATDTAISIKYPLTPFPITSLGNGFNLYYNIKTTAVVIDSTSTWPVGNSAGVYYQGSADPHYLGTFGLGLYDYSIRVPLRIQVPGNYELAIRLLNTTHR